MANVQSSNSIYVDSTGLVSNRVSIQVTAILFTSGAAGDSITLSDGLIDGGPLKIKVKNVDASTSLFRLADSPLLFANGIYVHAISSGAVATLITRNQGNVK